MERVEGAYLHVHGDLAKEPVDVVQSFATDDDFAERREEFTVYVAQLANRLTQAGDAVPDRPKVAALSVK